MSGPTKAALIEENKRLHQRLADMMKNALNSEDAAIRVDKERAEQAAKDARTIRELSDALESTKDDVTFIVALLRTTALGRPLTVNEIHV